MAKEIIERESLAREIIAAGTTHAPTITQAFKERFAPFATNAEKKKLPDLGFAVALCTRALTSARDKALAAGEAHEKELSDDDAPRKARDSACEELVPLLVGIRGSVDNVYGGAGLRALGIERHTPSEPKPVLEHSRKLLKRLEDKNLALPKPVHDGVVIDKAVWIGKLKPLAAKLEAALEKVALEERQAQVTLAQKNQAVRELDMALTQAGDLIAVGLDLIGKPELAEKIWPKVKRARPAATEEPPAEEAPPSGVAPAAAPAVA